MAIVYATKTGNWNDPTVWNTNPNLPTQADDVYSNTFTVTVNTSPTVLSISNAAATGVTIGGQFVLTNGNTLICTAAIGVIGVSGSFYVITIPSSFLSGSLTTLRANVSFPAYGIIHSGFGTLNIIGNILASAGLTGINNNTGGTINITGNVAGNTGGIGSAINNGGVLNIDGNVVGGGGANAAIINSSGTLTITGTLTGGTSATGYAVANNSTASFNHIGIVQASSIGPAIGPGSATQVTVLTGPLLCSSPNDATAGVNPCIALRWFPADTALSTFCYEMRGATASGSPSVRPVRQLFLTDAYTSGYPSVANVRKSTTYGPLGIYTGTLIVPPAASVIVGTPVDATVGTAVISNTDVQAFWAIPANTSFAAGSMGERMVKLATVSSVGDQIAAMKQATN